MLEVKLWPRNARHLSIYLKTLHQITYPCFSSIRPMPEWLKKSIFILRYVSVWQYIPVISALRWLRQDCQFEVSLGYTISLFINKHSHKFKRVHHCYSFLNHQIVRVKLLWRGTRIWMLGFCYLRHEILPLCVFLPVKLHFSYLITC